MRVFSIISSASLTLTRATTPQLHVILIFWRQQCAFRWSWTEVARPGRVFSRGAAGEVPSVGEVTGDEAGRDYVGQGSLPLLNYLDHSHTSQCMRLTTLLGLHHSSLSPPPLPTTGRIDLITYIAHIEGRNQATGRHLATDTVFPTGVICSVMVSSLDKVLVHYTWFIWEVK